MILLLCAQRSRIDRNKIRLDHWRQCKLKMKGNVKLRGPYGAVKGWNAASQRCRLQVVIDGVCFRVSVGRVSVDQLR